MSVSYIACGKAQVSTIDYIVILGLICLIIATLIWAYKKRNRLFFNAHFTAETTMMNYQTEARRSAMERIAYMKDEKQEDEKGEGKE